jgi:hypothetical protein
MEPDPIFRKAICKRCRENFVIGSPGPQDIWSDEDDKEWNKGYVQCPDSLDYWPPNFGSCQSAAELWAINDGRISVWDEKNSENFLG